MASIRTFDNRTKPWQVSIGRKGQRFVEYFRTKKDADAFAAKVEADFDRWAKILGGELDQLVKLVCRPISPEPVSI
ncbi:hypothetical protein [Allochromatium vinosum]|uniref:hypothetical protein n=1 Tax=Allochromatium vinosum TaxID=1049 RepID=UPI001907E5C0|nr:hypothetical protein [Allochromatium vinosum]MBK1654739.1 hypothetical protein [Allochromatium vinosum]